MHIVVCVKPILDPELPPRDFRIDPATQRPVRGNHPLVMDSYAENALETAIQLRDRIPGSTVTALCVGDAEAEPVLRRAYALTANGAVRVWDPGWQDLDGLAVAHILAGAIRALGGADLILTGRQAGDVEEGLVGPALAEELGIPCVTLVAEAEVEGRTVRATREAPDGHEVVSVPLPAVLTVTNSRSNVPRLPKTKDVMMARAKPIRVLGRGDGRWDPDRLVPGVRLERMTVPESDVRCEVLPGKDGAEQAAHLVRRMQELKLL